MTDIDSSLFSSLLCEVTDTFFVVLKDDEIVYANPAFCKALDTFESSCIGQNISDFLLDTDLCLLKSQKLNLGKTDYFNLHFKNNSGKIIDVKVRLIPTTLGGEKMTIIEAYDLSSTAELIKRNKFLEEKLIHLSPVDLETNLPSSVLFVDRVDQAMLRALRTARGDLSQIEDLLLIVIFKITNIKEIEEKYGLEARRHILDVLISRFKATIRSVDTLSKPLQESMAKNREDSFYFIFENVKEKDNVQIITDRIQNVALVPITYDKNEIVLNFEIGIASYPENGTTPTALIKWAKLHPIH